MKGLTFKMILTPVWENYLKLILELHEKKGEARVTDIAERFDVTKATVSQTVKKLNNYGFVQKEKNGAIGLTDIGKEKAIAVQKRNLIIKVFLTEFLGVNSQISEKDACMMEHIISSQTLEKIKITIKKRSK